MEYCRNAEIIVSKHLKTISKEQTNTKQGLAQFSAKTGEIYIRVYREKTDAYWIVVREFKRRDCVDRCD